MKCKTVARNKVLIHISLYKFRKHNTASVHHTAQQTYDISKEQDHTIWYIGRDILASLQSTISDGISLPRYLINSDGIFLPPYNTYLVLYFNCTCSIWPIMIWLVDSHRPLCGLNPDDQFYFQSCPYTSTSKVVLPHVCFTK